MCRIKTMSSYDGVVVKNVRQSRILEKYNDCRKNIQRRIRNASGAIVDSTQYGRVISKLIAVSTHSQ